MRNRRGSNALEFALTLPIIVAVLAGILEYGWYLFQLSNVVHALRDGTRIGVTVPSTDETGAETRAETHARAVMDGLGVPCSDGMSCVVKATIEPAGDAQTLRMNIEVDYSPLVGLLPTPSQLRGSFTMMMQEQS